MSISTVLVIDVEEIALELIDFINASGFADMADLMQTHDFYWFLQYTTLIRANRHHKLSMSISEYQERIRKALRNSDPKWNDFVPELVDEMYLKVSHDFPQKFDSERHFYITQGYGPRVHVDIFLSDKALDLGIHSVESISDLVY
jgi:hypothetical protein